MSAAFPPPADDRRQAVDEALAQRLPAREWPADLRRVYEERSHAADLASLSFHMKLGIAISFASLAIDAVTMPHLLALGLQWRVLAVLPLQLCGLLFARRKNLAGLKAATAGSLIMFGAMVMHLASFGDTGMQVRYSMAAAFLLAASTLSLPFTLREATRYMLGFALASITIGLWPNPIAPAMLGQHIVMLALIGGGTWGLLHRMRSFNARGFLYELRDQFSREELEENNRLLRELSERDPLTGLPNRRRFERAFEELTTARLAQGNTRSGGRPGAALMMIDLDHFKALNDTHGHVAGDECLRQVAAALEARAGEVGGVCARFGGEEFVLASCHSSFEEAAHFAEALRRDVAQLIIPSRRHGTARVTASLGIAFAPLEQASDYMALVEFADEALYCAKEGGRDRIELMVLSPDLIAAEEYAD